MRLLFILLAMPFVATAQDSTPFKKLYTLQGTWTMNSNRGMLYEHWRLQDDSTLLGKSFKIAPAGDTLVLEEVTLALRRQTIVYMPQVRGQNNGETVTFKLVSTTNDTYVFDNPAHDFPQRVIYELPKNDKLHAWIEGMDKGSYRKSDYYFKKEN